MAKQLPFREVNARASFPHIEENILKFWQEKDIFAASMEQRAGAPPYVFYEGPPTANGKPGVHHVLARSFKDIFPRYQTMRGRYVSRKGGWDTHGLPVELEVEKQIGSKGKSDIEKYGIAAFNEKCRESVFYYVQEWERMTERIGFWVDMKNPYITYDNNYIESVWWSLKTLWDKGLIYQGYKISMHCPRCVTSLADAEVALGFKDNVDDPSVWIKFRLAAQEGDLVGASFLVWTTTPWTLPANVAVALKGDADYLLVRLKPPGDTPEEDQAQPLQEGEKYILAAALADRVLGADKYEVIHTYKGSELVGERYANLFEGVPGAGDKPDMRNAYQVIADDFVSLDDGTGLVHIAPAYGDLDVGRAHGLPTLFSIDLRGQVYPQLSKFAGLFFKKADPLITQDLKERGLLFRSERVKHSYPFCWRCETPLLFYAKSSWYVRTTARKERLVELNKEINWEPAHIREGRFGNWLENNIDWAISRERYWGTPIPIWQCDTCGHQDCIGSIEELRALSGKAAAEGETTKLDLHKPHVDEFTWSCKVCHKGTMKRIPEVLDCWYDSGAMPFAQWHYPFENKELFAEQFPADYICEAIDQTRGWFYTLHAIATLVFDSTAYKNVICLGHILDGNGAKMSKRLGNIVNPWEVLNEHGADALRWCLYVASPPGNPRRFSIDLVGDAVRRFFLTLWNTYAFFVLYANLDGFTPHEGLSVPLEERPVMDRWILSELYLLVEGVTAALDTYDVTGAARAIETFVDGLSNWYVRRNRRRFWKGDNDDDKRAAYQTLHECLVTVAKLVAPFAPFISEEIYQNLVRHNDPQAPLSVHMVDWPKVDISRVDRQLVDDTRAVVKVVGIGRAARNAAKLKTRQPLAGAIVKPRTPAEGGGIKRFEQAVLEELNVKTLEIIQHAGDLVNYTVRPNLPLLGPRLGRQLGAVRQALATAEPNTLASRAGAGLPVTLTLSDGTSVELQPEDLLITMQEKAGYAVAEEGGYVVALDTALTPALLQEGLARDFVRIVQDLRKKADFNVDDKIAVYYEGSEEIKDAITSFNDYVKAETLALTVNSALENNEGIITDEAKVGNEKVRIGVKRL